MWHRSRFQTPAPYQVLTAVVCLLTPLCPAWAQARWTVDPAYSLAWWQVNPHLNHLWATTCPEEPSWRPGEGRSAGWTIAAGLRAPKHGYAGVSDTTLVPSTLGSRLCPCAAMRWQGTSSCPTRYAGGASAAR